MRIGLFALAVICLLAGCKSTGGLSGQEKMVSLSYQGMYWQQDKMMLNYVLTNDSKEEIMIFRPRPIEEYRNFVPAHVPPEFFELTVLPIEALCMSAPMNSGTDDVKTPNDLVRIPAGESYSFTINTNHYDREICDEETTEIRVALRYRFRDNYLDREYFDRRVTSKGHLSQEQGDELFGMVQQLYRETIAADTVSISL